MLYENCVRFKTIKQTSWFSLDLFRSLMGISQDKYRSFKELKRNVINVAVNEINQKSDIYLETEFKKSSRTIVALQFKIRDNENYQPTFRKPRESNITKKPERQTTLIEILMSDYHLSEKQAREIVNHHPNEYI